MAEKVNANRRVPPSTQRALNSRENLVAIATEAVRLLETQPNHDSHRSSSLSPPPTDDGDQPKVDQQKGDAKAPGEETDELVITRTLSKLKCFLPAVPR